MMNSLASEKLPRDFKQLLCLHIQNLRVWLCAASGQAEKYNISNCMAKCSASIGVLLLK
jgi:hypothetical protein